MSSSPYIKGVLPLEKYSPFPFVMPFNPQTVYASEPVPLSFIPFPGYSIADISDETYRGYVFTQ